MPVDTEKIKALAQRIRQAGYSGVREARRSLLDREKVRDRVLPVLTTSSGKPIDILSNAWKQYRDPNSSSEAYINSLEDRVDDIKDRGERYDYELEEAEGDLRMAKQHEDAKRLYLGYGAKYGTMEPSPYQPTIGTADNPYQVNPLLRDDEFEWAVLPAYTEWKTGNKSDYGYSVEDRGKTALLKNFPYLSNATMSEGHDDKGHYISLYDIWDYNTSISGKPGDNIGRIVGGKPVEIYQRYYLDDWLDIPEKARGNHFLAPATITEYVDTGEDEYKAGGNLYWPGGGLRVVPELLSSGMRNLRQKIADTRTGRRLAQELGVKPKTIELSTGETVPVTATNGLLPWLLGGTNPSAVSERTAQLSVRLPQYITKTKKALGAEKTAGTRNPDIKDQNRLLEAAETVIKNGNRRNKYLGTDFEKYPEFAQFLQESNLEPSQQAVDLFAKRQAASIRGVQSPEHFKPLTTEEIKRLIDKGFIKNLDFGDQSQFRDIMQLYNGYKIPQDQQQALENLFLTHSRYFPHIQEVTDNLLQSPFGADRLGSNGVYSSNSFGVANANAIGYGGKSGMTGIIEMPISYDRTLPLEKQLDQIAHPVFSYDDIIAGVLPKDDPFFISKAANKAGFTLGDHTYTQYIKKNLPIAERTTVSPKYRFNLLEKIPSDPLLLPQGNKTDRYGLSAQKFFPIDKKLFIPKISTDRDIERVADLLSWLETPTGEPMYATGGKIHIKPENRGKFTAKAKRAGQGVQQYARHVLANKENYPSSTVKQARFAKAAASLQHGDGGLINNGYGLTRYPFPFSYDRAVATGDTVQMSVPDAEVFTKHYKDYYPGFKQYGPGGRLIPQLIGQPLRNLRQRIADSKAGQRIAQELGIKPKTVELSSGETVPITATNGLLPWLLGGTNPSAIAGKPVTRFRVAKAIEWTPYVGDSATNQERYKIGEAYSKAKNYITSPERAEYERKLENTARALGYIKENEPLLFERPIIDPAPSYSITGRIKQNEMGTTYGVFYPDKNHFDVLREGLSRDTPIHEALHMMRLGDTPDVWQYERLSNSFDASTRELLSTFTEVKKQRDDILYGGSKKYSELQKTLRAAQNELIQARKNNESAATIAELDKKVKSINEEFESLPERITLRAKSKEIQDLSPDILRFENAYRGSKAFRKKRAIQLIDTPALVDAYDGDFEAYRHRYDYLSRPSEAAVHPLATGIYLGIEPFSAYPGNAKFDNIYQDALQQNKNFQFFRHNTDNEKRLLWKAMTGSFLGVPAAGYLAKPDKTDNIEEEYRKGGKIHIKPENRGKFTAKAKRAGQGVQQYARHVLANKENYPSSTVKQARFAKAAASWQHGDGGIIERYGADAVREALKKRNAHTYDGITEETQQMNYEIPSVAAYAAQTPMLYSSQNGVMLQELPAAGIVETAPVSAYRINQESPYQIAVEVPQEDVQIPYAIEPGVKNEFFIPENYQSIVKPMLSQTQQALSSRDVVGVARPDLTKGEEQQLQFADYVKAAEALGSNKNKLIEQQVNSLKNGEDLREFQKMLLQNGYYRDLPTPTITAKTKAEVTALQQKLIDAGYDLGPKGADGVIGDYTRAAWRKYVKEQPDEAMIEYVADAKIGRRTRAAARLYYEDITRTPAKKQAEKPVEEVKRVEELLPQISLDSIVPTSGLALRMSKNISDRDRKRNRYTLYPEHGINQLVGTLASNRGNAAADSVETWQTRLQQAIASGDSTEIANSRKGLMQARSGLLHVPGRKSLTKAEQQQALAILTSLNGDKPMTYEDYVAYCNKLGKKPGSWLGTGATSSDANGAKVPLYGGRSSYGFTNQVEDAAGNIESYDAEHGYRTENGRIVDSLGNPLTRKQQLMRTDARIYTDPNRGRLGGWSWRVTENGDIEISDNFEATDQTAAKGRNDDSAYNEARASWKRGTTHPLRHTIKKEKYEEVVKRALDSLTTNK